MKVRIYLLEVTDLYQLCEFNYFIRNIGQPYASNSKDTLKQLSIYK